MTDFKPGRELDALIAEKVMGWRKANKYEERCYWHTKEGRKLDWLYKSTGEYYECDCLFWNPSEDISAAWEVVEKIKTNYCKDKELQGYGFILETCTEGYSDLPQHEGKYLAIFPKTVCSPPFEEMNRDCYAIADTASLAICLAALKIIGSQNDSEVIMSRDETGGGK